MNKVIILLIIFLIIVYAYLYIKIKKTREKTNNIDSVRDFNNSYQNLTGIQKTDRLNRNNQNSPYNNYVTKYNSSEDYREKR